MTNPVGGGARTWEYCLWKQTTSVETTSFVLTASAAGVDLANFTHPPARSIYRFTFLTSEPTARQILPRVLTFSKHISLNSTAGRLAHRLSLFASQIFPRPWQELSAVARGLHTNQGSSSVFSETSARSPNASRTDGLRRKATGSASQRAPPINSTVLQSKALNT